MFLKNEKGISLITLIITVVVIVIIATISMQTSSEAPDQAHFAKYKQTMKDVQTGLDNQKILNSKNGLSVDDLTKGFDKVTLKNPPPEFLSFDEYYEDVTGYLVNMETIKFDNSDYGMGYKDVDITKPLEFGRNGYDAYVFDANWNVFYLKGLEYDGSMNYSL